MGYNIFHAMPLETALKDAGFKVDGIEKKDGKTIITVERIILEGATSAAYARRENSGPAKMNKKW